MDSSDNVGYILSSMIFVGNSSPSLRIADVVEVNAIEVIATCQVSAETCKAGATNKGRKYITLAIDCPNVRMNKADAEALFSLATTDVDYLIIRQILRENGTATNAFAIGMENLEKWFAAGVFCVGMGSKLFPKDKVAAGDWQYVTDKCKEALGYCLGVRK